MSRVCSSHPSRRIVRRAVVFAVLAVVVSACGTGSPRPDPTAAPTTVGDTTIRDELPQPQTIRSRDGILDTVLDLKPTTRKILGSSVRTVLFNGQLPGPTLVVHPGDVLGVNFVNHSAQMSNLHVHGLHVSPLGDADNVFREVRPGGSARYEYRIPRDHPVGTYWYHPHMHGLTEPQISGGLVGALIVTGGASDDVPGVRDLPERTMVLQRTSVVGNRIVNDGSADKQSAHFLLNGVHRPVLTLADGQRQRWRLINASADAFVNLQLPGHQFAVIGVDGNPVTRVYTTNSVVLAAGERRDVVVTGGTATAMLQTAGFRAGFVDTAAEPIATVRTAPRIGPSSPLPKQFDAPRDLRQDDVAEQRTMVYTEKFPMYYINGRTFDHMRTDVTSVRGTTEEWKIVNRGREWHTFHIHQNPVQVIADDNVRMKDVVYADTPVVAPGHTLTIRMRFADYPGRFVFHCHLLAHEDGGMMGTIEVVRPR